MISLDQNLWLFTYPLSVAGVNLRRNVTVIRLQSGKLVIHSTAAFPGEDVAMIESLGTPGWIVEAMLRHDTFAREGRTAFPDVPYLAPPGFGDKVDFATRHIFPLPREWSNELVALELQGIPSMKETVFFHAPSRTLIVADLVMNFHDPEPLWSELMIQAAVGSQHSPGMSRAFKLSIADENAFTASVQEILAWDFDRLIVGHGEVIPSGAKPKLIGALYHAGIKVAAPIAVT